jgi:predicted RNA-binding protein YlqC (UPF0109 family)
LTTGGTGKAVRNKKFGRFGRSSEQTGLLEEKVALKDLAEYLVKSLTDHPDKVELDEREEDDTVIISLRMSPDDIGKIIGKSGNTINAIRTVLQTAASSRKKRAKLEVVGQGNVPIEENLDNDTES